MERPRRFLRTRSLYGRVCRAARGLMAQARARLREPRAVASNEAQSQLQASALQASADDNLHSVQGGRIEAKREN